MTQFAVTTIGEANLRMSVPAGRRLETARQFEVHVAGAEANVVGGLSRLGWHCGWISQLPNTPIGYRVRQSFAPAGIDISAVKWTDEGNLATLFVEYADGPRVTQVFYDRKNSCFAKMEIDDVNWDYLLDTRLLHLTGITAALSAPCENLVVEAIRRAKARNISISFDINYRKKLWPNEKARATLQPIIQDIDLLFCRERDAATLFKCEGTPQEKIKQLHHICHAEKIVMSLGADGVLGFDGDQFIHEPAIQVNIIDRIGAGDALAAGVIHGWLQGDFPRGLRFGVTMAALALSQYGDMVITSPPELKALMERTYDGIDR